MIRKINEGGLELFVCLAPQTLRGVHDHQHITQQVFGGMALVLEIMTGILIFQEVAVVLYNDHELGHLNRNTLETTQKIVD